MGLRTFTWAHVAISLIAIGAGIVVTVGLLTDQPFDGWTFVFLAATLLTSATGFGFPFTKLLPSHVLGVISLVVLVVTVAARYGFHFAGAWRWIYVICAVVSLYLNVFVLIVQALPRTPVLSRCCGGD